MQMRSLPQARAPSPTERERKKRTERTTRLGFSVPRPPGRTGDPWPSDKELMAKNFLNKKSSRATKTTQGVLHKIYSIQKKKKHLQFSSPVQGFVGEGSRQARNASSKPPTTAASVETRTGPTGMLHKNVARCSGVGSVWP